MPDRYGDPESEDATAVNLDADTARLSAQAIVDCELCDDDGYRGPRVCDHVDHTAAYERGMAKVRAVLGKDGAE